MNSIVADARSYKGREGRLKGVVVTEDIDAVPELIMQDRHLTYREINILGH